MTDEPTEVRSRWGRLRAYLSHNGLRILVDLVVMVAWVVASWSVFELLALPQWLLYLVLFSGVIVYAYLTPPWERPYRSPDLGA